MITNFCKWLFITLLYILSFGSDLEAAPLKVVVSIKPIHSLVCGVMAGVGVPNLLLEGAVSPHSYALRPHDAQILQQANVIIWIGKSCETFLAKPIQTLSPNAKVITLIDTQKLILHPNREGGLWGKHVHDMEEEHHHSHTDTIDSHLWLDPENAKIIVKEIAQVFASLDPQHAAKYFQNAEMVIKRIDVLDHDLQTKLQPIQNKPYMVFHDACQYFDQHYKTQGVGSVTTHHESQPNSQHLYEIRHKLKEGNVQCLFFEPYFNPSFVATLAEDTGVKTAVLDPLGSTIPPGPNAYFEIMQQLGDQLLRGLQK